MVVLPVFPEMIGDLGDPVGENRHLDLRRTRIPGMPLVRLQNLLFLPLVQLLLHLTFL